MAWHNEGKGGLWIMVIAIVFIILCMTIMTLENVGKNIN